MKLQVVSQRRVTGGPEALHQLVDAARRLGVDARIVYAPMPQSGGPVTTAYAVYDVRVDSMLDDSASTLVVVPETLTRIALRLRHARRAIWWLSVDNYLLDQTRLAPRWAERLRLRGRRFDLRSPLPGMHHCAQSEYARAFLQAHGIAHPEMLTDYLRGADSAPQAPSAPAAPAARQARVAYNPAKGLEVTRRIMAATPPGLTFVALEGLSAAGVQDTLRSCAVYIDFGSHPGRDRLPREAALCGCNVVTGRLGAAGNAVDVPIPEAYKIDEAGADFIDRAVRVIERAAVGGAQTSADFDGYRAAIRGQRAVFSLEVGRLVEHFQAAGP